MRICRTAFLARCSLISCEAARAKPSAPSEDRASEEEGPSEALERLGGVEESYEVLFESNVGEQEAVVSLSRHVKDEDKVGEQRERRLRWRGPEMVLTTSCLTTFVVLCLHTKMVGQAQAEGCSLGTLMMPGCFGSRL